jgi:hypothetical protein
MTIEKIALDLTIAQKDYVFIYILLKSYQPVPGGIRSHDPLFQSCCWYMETIPLYRATRATIGQKVQVYVILMVTDIKS